MTAEHPWFGPGAVGLELEARRHVKEELRTRMRRQRGVFPEDARDARSARIVSNVMALPEWHAAKWVASFVPMRKEVDVSALRSAAYASGKRVALPRVDRESGNLVFAEVFVDTALIESAFGVEEPPASAAVVDPHSLDLVVVPGLAFDERGYRIGYGKGYYDRFLPGLSAFTVGVAYEFERLAELPNMDWDVPVRAVATDDGLYISER